MKIIKILTFTALAAASLVLTSRPAIGQSPLNISLSRNGRLVSENLQPGSTANIEWASSVLGPWTNNWTALESVAVDANGMIQVNVPMFYRVRGIQLPSLGKVTFTKWITSDPNLPGLLQTLEGVVGGEIGDGTYTGEVLKETIVGDLDEVVAFYHFTGSKHSFSAIIHLKFNLVSLKAVFSGVITDGWMKGHAVEGTMTQIDSFQGHAPAYTATLDIKSAYASPSPSHVTFTKWVTSFPNRPGLIADMAGVVGGDAGIGTFTGEAFLDSFVGNVEKVVALYHFHGPTHSFDALVHVEQTGATTGSKAVIIGVVTDGWLKGHALKGEYTQTECNHVGIDTFCYEGTLEID